MTALHDYSEFNETMLGPMQRECDLAVETRERPTGGPVRSDLERTAFFPSHSVGLSDLVP